PGHVARLRGGPRAWFARGCRGVHRQDQLRSGPAITDHPRDRVVMQPAKPIRVLLADAGGVSRDPIIHPLDRDGRFQVVAIASDGIAAADTTARLRPDIVVMNLRLPPLDGIDATRRIMAETPTPVV